MSDKEDPVRADDSEEKLGALGQLQDGRAFVKFVRRLPYSIETVWQALAEPAQRALWFPGFKLELRQGGQFEMWFGVECEGPAHVSGTVVECEPLRVLRCGDMRWELAANGSQACTLTFTDVLVFQGGRTQAEIANSVLAGWHQGLDFLEDALAGRTVDHKAPELDYSVLEIPGRA